MLGVVVRPDLTGSNATAFCPVTAADHNRRQILEIDNQNKEHVGGHNGPLLSVNL
jgi:hypothetical protein